MKKVLLAIAAAALACTLAVSFAACGNNGNGGNGGNGEEEDSVLTEEQWVKAFEDTLASKTVSGEAIYVRSITDDEGISHADARSELSFEIDFNNYAVYQKYKYQSMTIVPGEDREPDITENYGIIDGTKIISYSYSRDYTTNEYKWNASADEQASQEAAREAFINNASLDVVLGEVVGLTSVWTAKVGEEAVEGQLSELFSAFTYDDSTHAYCADLTRDDMTFNYKISFKQGKISEMELSLSEATEGGTQNENAEITLSYEAPSIEVPQAAKDALAEVQQ